MSERHRCIDPASFIDHTLLRPEAIKSDVLRLCEEARAHGFGVIFVPPCYVDEAVAAVRGTSIRVGIPIGFPLGAHTTKTKVAEAVEAAARGAKELDMVINISRLKSGDYDGVQRDIAEVVRSTPAVGHKVILETCYLTRQEKITACRLVVDAGAEYVKTSTGFGAGGGTVEDVRLMKATVEGQAKVKASGGIRDLKATLALLEAGADRIGTSASLKIMEEWEATQRPR
ncbi:MAG: deoxyribose-phosphate aldolase [Nitrospiraceae bacterium]